MRIRQIAQTNYNETVNGLSGVCVGIVLYLFHCLPCKHVQNEDCGQMSAWFIYSALGFYPVNPVLGNYVVGRCVLNIM
jgi:putative alpha-1,2-mannosidase